jgi:putative endonuclease
MYYTYILFSIKLNKYYIGSTDNVERRFCEHNSGKTPFTSTGIPWILKYFETFQSRTEAYQREIYIKNRKSRIFIEKLIASSEHPV